MTKRLIYVLLLAVTAAAACKSAPQKEQSGEPEEQEQLAEPAEEPADTSDSEDKLTLAERQTLWRCAAQLGDTRRADALELNPEQARQALDEALRTTENEAQRYARLQKNWNVEWDPAGITEWAFGWGHRGFRVSGQAKSVGDVAELTQRMQTSEGMPALTISQIEAIEGSAESGYTFELVEATASDSARGPGELAALMADATEKGVQAVVEQRCDWSGSDAPDAPDEQTPGAPWKAKEARVDRLHRIHTWRAGISDEQLDNVLKAASEYDGAGFAPDGDGYIVTLYRIEPRSDAEFAPHAVPETPPAPPKGAWSAQLECEEAPFCGVEIESAEVRSRVERTVKLVERADRFHTMHEAIAYLRTSRVPLHAVVSCLREQAPTARPDDEQTSQEEHAQTQAGKPLRVRAFTYRDGTFELQYDDAAAPEGFDLVAELDACLADADGVASAAVEAVDGGESRVRVSVEPEVDDEERELPPWNSNGAKTARQIIEGFAGPNGEKWKKWLSDRVSTQQRQLLISLEMLPQRLEDAALSQRLENMTRTAGATMHELAYVHSALSPSAVVRAHRFRIATTGSPTEVLSALYYWGRMTRILSPVSVEYDAESAKMVGEFEVFSYETSD